LKPPLARLALSHARVGDLVRDGGECNSVAQDVECGNDFEAPSRFSAMTANERPTRDAFIAYWQHARDFGWDDVLLYIVYPGLLAFFTIVVRSVDVEGRFWIIEMIVAVGYVILYPYTLIGYIQLRFARFIRCPRCGDWFGRDQSGAYVGPNPKFRIVIETGRCATCGQQILADHAIAD
jgi:ribosomal protein S27AE